MVRKLERVADQILQDPPQLYRIAYDHRQRVVGDRRRETGHYKSSINVMENDRYGPDRRWNPRASILALGSVTYLD